MFGYDDLKHPRFVGRTCVMAACHFFNSKEDGTCCPGRGSLRAASVEGRDAGWAKAAGDTNSGKQLMLNVTARITKRHPRAEIK
jgi:hypothetical protein